MHLKCMSGEQQKLKGVAAATRGLVEQGGRCRETAKPGAVQPAIEAAACTKPAARKPQSCPAWRNVNAVMRASEVVEGFQTRSRTGQRGCSPNEAGCEEAGGGVVHGEHLKASSSSAKAARHEEEECTARIPRRALAPPRPHGTMMKSARRGSHGER